MAFSIGAAKRMQLRCDSRIGRYTTLSNNTPIEEASLLSVLVRVVVRKFLKNRIILDPNKNNRLHVR